MRGECYNLKRCDKRKIGEKKIQGEQKSPLKENNEKNNLKD
jgi:hypothetical protein